MGEGCGLLVRIGRRGHFLLSFSNTYGMGRAMASCRQVQCLGGLLLLLLVLFVLN